MKDLLAIQTDAFLPALNQTGFATIPEVFSKQECEQMAGLYDDEKYFRKTIDMARYQFGSGEYKYFKHPLPDLVQLLRKSLYPLLAPVANDWMSKLKIQTSFPDSLSEFQKICVKHGQSKATPLLLKYKTGGYNTLHQDLYGAVWFPFQVVVFLSQAGEDYTGGEFVLVEQRPRMQSKARVLSPKQGDVLVFTTQFRPVAGTKGWYRVGMKHGVSEVLSGKRQTLGIIFHDAV